MRLSSFGSYIIWLVVLVSALIGFISMESGERFLTDGVVRPVGIIISSLCLFMYTITLSDDLSEALSFKYKVVERGEHYKIFIAVSGSSTYAFVKAESTLDLDCPLIAPI